MYIERYNFVNAQPRKNGKNEVTAEPLIQLYPCIVQKWVGKGVCRRTF